MAIAKPIRALVFAALILCSFLFYTIYKTHTGPPLGPGDIIKSYDGTGKDPMGERQWCLILTQVYDANNY